MRWFTPLFSVSLLLFSSITTAADRALIVQTSHNKMGSLDKKMGYWLGELTHPYYTLFDAGIGLILPASKGVCPHCPSKFRYQ